MLAAKNPEKSTIPKHAATIYETIIPIRNGMTFNIPLPRMAITAVVKNATSATIRLFIGTTA